jgi:hypothetical protein
MTKSYNGSSFQVKEKLTEDGFQNPEDSTSQTEDRRLKQRKGESGRGSSEEVKSSEKIRGQKSEDGEENR